MSYDRRVRRRRTTKNPTRSKHRQPQRTITAVPDDEVGSRSKVAREVVKQAGRGRAARLDAQGRTIVASAQEMVGRARASDAKAAAKKRERQARKKRRSK